MLVGCSARAASGQAAAAPPSSVMNSRRGQILTAIPNSVRWPTTFGDCGTLLAQKPSVLCVHKPRLLAIAGCRKRRVRCAESSGNLLPPSPPGEKATSCRYEAWEASTDDRARYGMWALVMGLHPTALARSTKSPSDALRLLAIWITSVMSYGEPGAIADNVGNVVPVVFQDCAPKPVP